MTEAPSTSFRQLAPFTPRVVSVDYEAFPLDNVILVYGNTPQSYTAVCDLPGFPPVTVTIPANSFSSFISQADANQKALAAATAEAQAELICCYSFDPLPDTPPFASLSNEYNVSLSNQYGYLAMANVAEDVEPFVSNLYNWTICPTCDFCSGPDTEGVTQNSPYSLRWFCRIADGQPVYGKVGGSSTPVPTELLTGIDTTKITYFSISFDANARPCFGIQVTPGQIQIRRYVAGSPTSNAFAGDHPRLWYDGVLQPDISKQDVICFYDRVGVIQQRFQRDNFGVEYAALTPTPQVARITKVDNAGFYNLIYFIDTGGNYWVARSSPYPLPAQSYEDFLTALVNPQGGTYAQVTVPGGTYSDALSVSVDPGTGVYDSPVVSSGPYSDALTVTVGPTNGTYDATSVAGGTYSDALSASVAPLTGTYTVIAINGGSYSDNLSASVAPSGGDYSS